ncbi:MAG TPA: pilus assembly protein PilM, partial [Humidesulfovibrio sp.]|uniref:pilus assembly protein PilM n=1 Tax=Humidesulfovibrio sp. TaxID=2910988 RepID=UPI002BCEC823
ACPFPTESLLAGGDHLPRPAAPRTATPIWQRPIRFGQTGKPFSIGVSISGPSLFLAVVKQSNGALSVARRFLMQPDQAPGEKGFATFLNQCLSSLGFAPSSVDIWAVLRSSDLDLNVLSVPKLSGSKLDAAVYWTLQKDKKFAEAEYVLDYLPLGPTAEAKEPRLDVLTCLARRTDVDRLQAAFAAAGCPLTGITAIPNALLALYKLPGAPAGHTLAANIHVEPDFSAIGLYAKDRLLFSRFIRSGAGSMAEALAEHFQDLLKPKSQLLADLELPLPGAGENGADAAQEPLPALDSAQAQELLRHLLLGAPRPDFAREEYILPAEEVLEIISPAIERLARQVERTLEYYASSQQARCDALHLSGEIFGCPAIAQALAGQLGFPTVIFDPVALVRAGAEHASAADRMALAPALAAALAQPDKGINLISNYKVRTTQEAKRVVTRSIILGLAGLMVLIGLAGLVLERGNTAKRAELSVLKAQSAALGPLADESTLQLTVEQYRLRQDALRLASTRLLAPAAMADISRRAPQNIRILTLTAEYPQPEETKAAAPPPPGQTSAPAPAQNGKTAPGSQGSIVIEGVVMGERAGFDAALSRFIIDLQGSPMFQMPVVNESGLKELGDGGQVLYFVMHLGVK